jgi:Zn-dependent protease with chaperone function
LTPSSPPHAGQATRHYCRFSDGKSASASDGTVRLALQGLEIEARDGRLKCVWPYAGLRSGEPIRSSAIDVLLSSASDPGASLFVPGPSFAAALVAYAPHLTAKAERWRHARPWIAFAGLVAGLIALVYAAGWSPIYSIAATLPDSWRQRLGDEARASMTEGHDECVDGNGRAALDRLTRRLSQSADQAQPFKITVYDWSLMNAFAVPGGQIVLTRGLLEKAQSPDEVAGVLAHEMGHGVALHPETGIIRAIGLSAAVEVMMGGSGGALANIGLLLAQLGYTRAAEREADAQALKLLKGAGIAPQGLGDFFARIEKSEEEDGDLSKALKPFSILRSHPPTAERAALVRAQAHYPATPALDAQSWQDLKAICRTTAAPEKARAEPDTKA